MCASASFISYSVFQIVDRRSELVGQSERDPLRLATMLVLIGSDHQPSHVGEKASCGERGSPTRLLPASAARLGVIGVFAGSFPLLNGPSHRALPDNQAFEARGRNRTRLTSRDWIITEPGHPS